eukprot:CAMPEP_0116888282 /NCGR_PEP_ID=MMETSP0463-20121206/23220_1 /TAXON_ID=181622 /ORGANISM="Strombidinopsis sp, Strain SopsisLIS2011" /LENGTH=78 /DNA_ID=CAMNT_0004552723 /DNA_START=206 /DNA_END=442 /DNA_ORIENTATION=+
MDERQVSALNREIFNNIHLEHCSKIATSITALSTPNNVYYMMDYSNGGNLRELLSARGGRISEAETRKIVYQIAEGLN